jgi:hypothetical protein
MTDSHPDAAPAPRAADPAAELAARLAGCPAVVAAGPGRLTLALAGGESAGTASFDFGPVPPDPRAPLGYVVRALSFRPEGGDAPDPTALREALRQVAARAFPAAERWATAPEHRARLCAIESLWGVFGTRLWPGETAFDGWRTVAAAVDGPWLALDLSDTAGRPARLLLAAEAGRAAPPPEGARPCVAADSVSAWLVAAASGAAPDAAALDALAAAVRELVRLSGDLREEPPVAAPPEEESPRGGTPTPTPAPAPGPRGEGEDADRWALRVVFHDVRGELPDYVFSIRAAAAGPAFRQYGEVALVHETTERPEAVPALAVPLVQAMAQIGAPPDAENEARWIEAVQAAVARSRVRNRFQAEVSAIRPPS